MIRTSYRRCARQGKPGGKCRRGEIGVRREQRRAEGRPCGSGPVFSRWGEAAAPPAVSLLRLLRRHRHHQRRRHIGGAARTAARSKAARTRTQLLQVQSAFAAHGPVAAASAQAAERSIAGKCGGGQLALIQRERLRGSSITHGPRARRRAAVPAGTPISPRRTCRLASLPAPAPVRTS